ncbi:MAG: hypothetical protein JWM95_4453 [Gemmatimonadetes bacterium]|nr:hypothetical protein [Gemmatimonadota bacterium]
MPATPYLVVLAVYDGPLLVHTTELILDERPTLEHLRVAKMDAIGQSKNQVGHEPPTRPIARVTGVFPL